MILSCTIDSTGISAPSYADILAALQTQMQTIYGSDIYIDPDSQDGQMLAAFASAINDSNNATIAAFQSFAPDFAQGVGLSILVKINGIRRQVASFSTAPVLITGQAGTIILGGLVEDGNQNQWALPGSVIIPGGGSLTVTATSVAAGAIRAPSGTINTIVNPQAGWQAALSSSDATPGAPVETDAGLRQRQEVSVGIPALTVLDGLLGVLANLAGVTRVAIYENPTGVTDANTLPPHSIAVVIAGGDVLAIAQTIGQLKTPGCATYGTTSETYADPVTGITYTINFYVLSTQDIKVVVNGTAGAGYTSLIGTEIQNAIAAYINSLPIGADVEFSRIYLPAYLNGAVDGTTYEITSMTIQGSGGAGTGDIVIPFNKAAVCVAATDVTINIV